MTASMDAAFRTAMSFRFYRTLFRNEDGSPIMFYSDYQSESLRQIIERGGGYIVGERNKCRYALCEKKTDDRLSQGFLSVQFVLDCVKKNRLLDESRYRQSLRSSQNGESSCQSQKSSRRVVEEPDAFDLSSFKADSLPLHTGKRSLYSGRIKYTDAEDLKMIRYIVDNKRYSEIGGNILWKNMEALRVTLHTHQSMKARFRNVILKQINAYDIPAVWKAKLTGDFHTKWRDGSLGQVGSAPTTVAAAEKDIEEEDEEVVILDVPSPKSQTEKSNQPSVVEDLIDDDLDQLIVSSALSQSTSTQPQSSFAKPSSSSVPRKETPAQSCSSTMQPQSSKRTYCPVVQSQSSNQACKTSSQNQPQPPTQTHSTAASRETRSSSSQRQSPTQTRSTSGQPQSPTQKRLTSGQPQSPRLTRSTSGQPQSPRLTHSTSSQPQSPAQTHSTSGQPQSPRQTRSTSDQQQSSSSNQQQDPTVFRQCKKVQEKSGQAHNTQGGSDSPDTDNILQVEDKESLPSCSGLSSSARRKKKSSWSNSSSCSEMSCPAARGEKNPQFSNEGSDSESDGYDAEDEVRPNKVKGRSKRKGSRRDTRHEPVEKQLKVSGPSSKSSEAASQQRESSEEGGTENKERLHRRLMFLCRKFHLTLSEACMLLLEFDGNFQAAVASFYPS
ncbi:uncharacterized protein LOC101863615 isoform X2 [Aplysia californica]|uniref:Telomeric repeat-binding factor 2-interacting protein 1 n=1 Tax=Aplysia californica TaxID=6500 RepID=A0ABM1AA02_APLCA|nr:uncharacterized protein LOC101863615 isoform X2 [Aplysia californica]